MSKRRRRKQLSQLGPDGLPLPLKWRPRVRIFGLISGAIGGLGAVVLIQQYGIAPLGRALTLQGLIGGLLAGVVIPSLVFAFVVRTYNRKLAAARGRLSGGPAGSSGLGAAVLLVMLIGSFTAFGSAAAQATGQGPCRLVVEGRDVATLELTRSDAILVESETEFIASMSWPSDFASFEVRFFYMGFSYGFGDSEVDEDVNDGGPDSGTVELPVDLFFQYAGGLYEVHVDGVMANGQSCNFAMLFDVDRNPLDTVVGKVAAATAAVGAIGVLGVGAAAAVDGTRMVGDLTSMLDGIQVGTAIDGTGLDVNADGVMDTAVVDTTGDGLIDQIGIDIDGDGTVDRVMDVDYTGPTDAAPPAAPMPDPTVAPEPSVVPDGVEPAGVAPEPSVVPDGVEPAGVAPEPSVVPDGVEPAGVAPEPSVVPDGVEPAGVAPEPSVVPDGVEPAGVAPEPSVVPDAVEPAGVEPKVVPDTGAPGGPKVAPDMVEPAGVEPKVAPDTGAPGGPKVAPDATVPDGGVEPKVDSSSVESAVGSAGGPKVAPDTVEPAAGGPAGPKVTSPVESAADTARELPETPTQPIGEDAAPGEAIGEPPGPGTSEPDAVGEPPGQPGAGETAADAPGLGDKPPTGEVTPPDLTFVEPPEPATWEPGGGISGAKVGMAAGAILTPALLGSLGNAAKGRAGGAASTTVAFWFHVTEATPLFGLEDYNGVVGELSPGSWYLGQGTYGEWVHAVDSATNVEGWVAAHAALPAP